MSELKQGRFLADRHMPDGSVIKDVGCVHEADHDRVVAELTRERDAFDERIQLLRQSRDALAARVIELELNVTRVIDTVRIAERDYTERIDSLAADARRYRYWRQHQYQGLLDQDEYCDADSPQAVHFDRLTDAALAKEAKHASPQGEK